MKPPQASDTFWDAETVYLQLIAPNTDKTVQVQMAIQYASGDSSYKINLKVRFREVASFNDQNFVSQRKVLNWARYLLSCHIFRVLGEATRKTLPWLRRIWRAIGHALGCPSLTLPSISYTGIPPTQQTSHGLRKLDKGAENVNFLTRPLFSEDIAWLYQTEALGYGYPSLAFAQKIDPLNRKWRFITESKYNLNLNAHYILIYSLLSACWNDKQESYRGSIKVSKSGKTCENWFDNGYTEANGKYVYHLGNIMMIADSIIL